MFCQTVKFKWQKNGRSFRLYLLRCYRKLSDFRLSEFASAEREKANREEAHNSLESLVYDVADKIEQEQMQVEMANIYFSFFCRFK